MDWINRWNKMQNKLSEISGKHVIPLFILLGFTLWFAYDIYTLKRGLCTRILQAIIILIATGFPSNY